MGLHDVIDMRVRVKRIAICVGVDQNGQQMNANYASGPEMNLYVVPGKLCVIEVLRGGKKTVREQPIGPMGWEYDVWEHDA